MLEIAVIDEPTAAEVSLDPIRARLLAELAVPGSASTLAATLGLARQQVNYHLHALERHGVVELVEERRKGNVNERVMRATASSYVISPAALAASRPTRTARRTGRASRIDFSTLGTDACCKSTSTSTRVSKPSGSSESGLR